MKKKNIIDDKNDQESNEEVLNTSKDILNISMTNTAKGYLEKIEENGEDAEPLVVLIDGKFLLLTVCDGLGGAGSQKINRNGTTKSKAYIASREAIKYINNFFDKALTGKVSIEEKTFTNLEIHLKKQFKDLVNHYPRVESKIKSSLIKNFPTTMAGCIVEMIEKQAILHSFWAGDSRCYLITQTNGLQQISHDDLNLDFDAFQNLSGDSRMSNFINSDTDFKINYRKTVVTEPFIIFVTTDGAFDYLPTPMHFEKLLLDSILLSKDLDSMVKFIEDTLIKIPVGDDVSLSFFYTGWENFNDIKTDLKRRNDYLTENHTKEIDNLNNEVIKLNIQKQNIENSIKNKSELLSLQKLESWNKYKVNYYIK